jgi:hypothetical protein
VVDLMPTADLTSATGPTPAVGRIPTPAPDAVTDEVNRPIGLDPSAVEPPAGPMAPEPAPTGTWEPALSTTGPAVRPPAAGEPAPGETWEPFGADAARAPRDRRTTADVASAAAPTTTRSAADAARAATRSRRAAAGATPSGASKAGRSSAAGLAALVRRRAQRSGARTGPTGRSGSAGSGSGTGGAGDPYATGPVPGGSGSGLVLGRPVPGVHGPPSASGPADRGSGSGRDPRSTAGGLGGARPGAGTPSPGAPPTTSSGLARRVRGANLPAAGLRPVRRSGESGDPGSDTARPWGSAGPGPTGSAGTPEDVYGFLASFTSGVQRGLDDVARSRPHD